MAVTFEILDALTHANLDSPPSLESAAGITLHRTVYDGIADHPLLRRYTNRMRSAKAPLFNTRAEHALGERLWACLIMLAFDKIGTASIRNHERMGFAVKMLLSEVYLWGSESFRASIGVVVPKHVISRDLMPFPHMFWSLETSYSLETPEGYDTGASTNWMALVHNGDGINVLFDRVAEDGGLDLIGGSIPYGATYPDSFSEEEIKPVGRILSRLAFLNSPYIGTKPVTLGRAERREMERTPNISPDNQIHMVTLRRADKEHGDDGGNGIINYQHQWWVSGHLRAQWYPSTKSHKVIWIPPYIKGPVGKPFVQKVYHVVR
jgi:hypothetical protein